MFFKLLIGLFVCLLILLIFISAVFDSPFLFVLMHLMLCTNPRRELPYEQDGECWKESPGIPRSRFVGVAWNDFSLPRDTNS